MTEKELFERKIFLKWQLIEITLRDILELEVQLDQLEDGVGKKVESEQPTVSQ